MKRFSPTIFVLLPVAAITFAISGCGSKHESAKEDTSSLPVAQVQVQMVESKSRTMTEEVVGTVRAKLHATLEARLSGRIEKMPVLLGEQVRKGQLIARLDAGEIAARLEQTEASLEEADRNWKRASTLFEQQGVTRSEYDAAQSRLRIAKGAVAEAKAMMDYVEIVAPFNGVVTKKWVDVGDIAEPGKALLEIEDPTALQIEADVPETIVAKIQRGSRLDVSVDSASNIIEGVVSEIAPSADSASRTLRVKLELPQTKGLMPGQFARLAVAIGERNSVRIPMAAVVERGQLEIVFTVIHQHAQLHLVKTGKPVGDEIEILSGLDPGATVVISGADQLTDGQPVEAK